MRIDLRQDAVHGGAGIRHGGRLAHHDLGVNTVQLERSAFDHPVAQVVVKLYPAVGGLRVRNLGDLQQQAPQLAVVPVYKLYRLGAQPLASVPGQYREIPDEAVTVKGIGAHQRVGDGDLY